MKGKVIFGALLVSVALCSQAFAGEILDRVLGLNGGGCGPSGTAACCDPVKACEPACEKTACEPNCCKPCCQPVRELFGNLKDLVACKRCGKVRCCCPKPVCAAPCGDPTCCEAPKACPAPACC